MDDVVNRLARELSDAISAAIADDVRVEAARERARAAGYEMKVSLEAVIGFMNRSNSTALTKIGSGAVKAARSAERSFEISPNDKRFLRSLRIAADEAQEKEVE
jgi:4-hydroxy-3-methylbut-2-enyl diphosphate reductase IspH